MGEQTDFEFDNFDWGLLIGDQPTLENNNGEVVRDSPSTSQLQPIEAAQNRHSRKSKDKRSRLSERIASTDALVQNLKDFQETANTMKSLYETEKLQRVQHEENAQMFQHENELLRDEVAQLKLKCDQLQAQTDENKDIDVKELAWGYMRLIQRLTVEGESNIRAYGLSKREVQLVSRVKAYFKTNNISLPNVSPKSSPRRHRNATNKNDKAVECLIWTALPESVSPTKPDTCTRGTQSLATQTRDQSIQYKSTTTTRSTTTVGLVQKHDMGTSYTTPVQEPSITEILAEMRSWHVEPITPIIDLLPALSLTTAPTLPEEVIVQATPQSHSVGSCTLLCNVQKEIDYVQPFALPKIKHSRSRPPSRQMYTQDNVKDESQQQPMPLPPELDFDLGRPFSLSAGPFSETWQSFGQMAYLLLQHRNATTAPLAPLRGESFSDWLRTLTPTELLSPFFLNPHHITHNCKDVQKTEDAGLKKRRQSAESSPMHTLDYSDEMYVDIEQEHETSLHEKTQRSEYDIQRIQLIQPKVQSSEEQAIVAEARKIGDECTEADMQHNAEVTCAEASTNMSDKSSSIEKRPKSPAKTSSNEKLSESGEEVETESNFVAPDSCVDSDRYDTPHYSAKKKSSVEDMFHDSWSPSLLYDSDSESSFSSKSSTSEYSSDSSSSEDTSDRNSSKKVEIINPETPISQQSHTTAEQKRDAEDWASIKGLCENAVDFVNSFESHNPFLNKNEIALLATVNIDATSSSQSFPSPWSSPAYSSSPGNLMIDEDAMAQPDSNKSECSPELITDSLAANTVDTSDTVHNSKLVRKRQSSDNLAQLTTSSCKRSTHMNYLHDESLNEHNSITFSSTSSCDSFKTKEVVWPQAVTSTSRNSVNGTFAPPDDPNERTPSPIYVPEGKQCEYLHGYDTPASPPPVDIDEDAVEPQPTLIPHGVCRRQRLPLLSSLILRGTQISKGVNKKDPTTGQGHEKMVEIIAAYFTNTTIASEAALAAAAEALSMQLQQVSADAATYAAAFYDYVSSQIAQSEMCDRQRLVCAVRLLQDQHRDFVALLMEKIDDSLFRLKNSTNTLPMEIDLTQFYLTLAELETERATCSTSINADYRNPARIFIAKSLYYLPKTAMRLIYEVLAKFPCVLPHREERNYDHTDPLITVIKHELMHHRYDMSDPKSCDREMLSNLRFRYHFEAFKPLTQDALQLLVDNLKAGKLEHLQLAFVVFCKRLEIEKVVNKVLAESLMPLAKTFYGEALHGPTHDERIVVLLDCMSMIIKALPRALKVQIYLRLFTRFLKAIPRASVQEAAVQAIIRLQHFGYRACDHALRHFYPTQSPQTLTVSMLYSYIRRRRCYFGINKKIRQRCKTLFG